MTAKSPSTQADTTLVIQTMRNSLSIQSHFQLLLWMQSDVQEIIPHDVLISFSGPTGGETDHYDIVSAIPGIRTAKLPHHSISDFKAGIHARWLAGGGGVASASICEGDNDHIDPSDLHIALQNMQHVLFHAIPDTRHKADHLYILLRCDDAFSDHECKQFELLLPHIDTAVRKVEGLPIVEPEKLAPPNLLNSLIKAGVTTREIEILEWVRSGKTNFEIGVILDISVYTVKNHLQRIYKKMNVNNRAQAVGRLEETLENQVQVVPSTSSAAK